MSSMPQATTPPSERGQAPGGLRLIEELVNTRDVEHGLDGFSSVEGLAAWLRERALIAAEETVVEADRTRVVAFRERLRRLLLTHNGVAGRPEAGRELTDEVRSSLLRVAVGEDGCMTLVPACGGVDGAIAQLVAAITTAAIDGSWERMKACREDTCHWAFYDHSKNASGTWCSMAVCGNRAKVRRHRERQRAAG